MGHGNASGRGKYRQLQAIQMNSGEGSHPSSRRIYEPDQSPESRLLSRNVDVANPMRSNERLFK
jgi:hypothetical protein